MANGTAASSVMTCAKSTRGVLPAVKYTMSFGRESINRYVARVVRRTKRQGTSTYAAQWQESSTHIVNVNNYNPEPAFPESTQNINPAIAQSTQVAIHK